MEKRILNDMSASLKLVLQESQGGILVARGEFGRADAPTQNNRRYPRKIWEREVRRIQEAISAGKVLGQLEHPSSGKTDLNKVSHRITLLEIRDDGLIYGEAKILRNQYGDQLRSILEAGGAVGVSSRGMGSTASSDDGIEEVQDDYQYMTHDFVADPAVLTSYPKFTTEVRWIEPSKVIKEKVEDEEMKKKEQLSKPTEVKPPEASVEVKPDDQVPAVSASPAVDANKDVKAESSVSEETKNEVKAESGVSDEAKKDPPADLKADEPGPVDEPKPIEEPKIEPEETEEVRLTHADINLIKKALAAFVSDDVKPEKLEKLSNKFIGAKKGELEVEAPKDEAPEVPAPEAPKDEAPKEEMPKEEMPKGESLDDLKAKLKNDPEFSAAFIVMEDLKNIMRPFVLPADQAAEISGRDERIKKLSEDIDRIGAVANRLGAALHIQRMVNRYPEISDLIGNQVFEDVRAAERAVVEARKRSGRRVVLKKKREAEARVVERKWESRMEEMERKNQKLQRALEESMKMVRGFGIKLYLEERIRDLPSATQIRKLAEGKESKEEIDVLVEQHKHPVVSNEYSAVRRRLEKFQSVPLVEEHVKETGVDKPRVGGVEGEMEGLFKDLDEVKALL